MPPRDSVPGTLIIAAVLCFVCSLMVATARYSLKGLQDTNKELANQKTLLELSGVVDEKEMKTKSPDNIRDLFKKSLTPRIIDLETGDYAQNEKELLASPWDTKKLLLDKKTSGDINPKNDVAGIKSREVISRIYLIQDDSGKTEQFILPIRGKGLWSTLWGYISLKADGKTVNGIVFYEHAETPGLGGEIDNKNWRKKWHGKLIPYDNNTVKIAAVKGLDPKSPDAVHQFDSLSGATITSRGVENTLKFWLGDQGFRKYLDKYATK